jgi:hypothetical protein
MTDDFLRARAKIRDGVRRRLAVFDGHDIWRTQFFIDRVDLANEVMGHLNVLRNGEIIESAELLTIVRDEFLDFVVLQDERHTVEITETEAPQPCEKCRLSFQPAIDIMCPACSHPTLFQSSEKTLNDIRYLLNFETEETDPIRRRSIESLFHRRLESAYLNLVIAFERFCNQLNRFLFRVNGKAEQWPPHHNPFQKTWYDKPSGKRQFTAQDWFQNTHGIDIFATINKRDVDRLWLVFQKRHLIQHQGGIIDQRYIDMTNGNNADVGNPVSVEKDEAEKAVITTCAILLDLKTQYT